MYVCVYIYISIYVYIYTSSYDMYVCVRVCVYTRTHICSGYIYTHKYIHRIQSARQPGAATLPDRCDARGIASPQVGPTFSIRRRPIWPAPSRGAVAAHVGKLPRSKWLASILKNINNKIKVRLKKSGTVAAHAGTCYSKKSHYNVQKKKSRSKWLASDNNSQKPPRSNVPVASQSRCTWYGHTMPLTVGNFFLLWANLFPCQVTRLFCGQLRSHVKCSVCSRESNCYDPFMDLSLPIPQVRHICHMAHGTWHMSHGTCHMLHVTLDQCLNPKT